MNRFSGNVALRSVFGAAVLVCLSGCGKPVPKESSPSYADLVTIYNAELTSLDRLQRKREELIAKHEAALTPATEDAAKVLDAILSSATEAGSLTGLENVTDPNELLDRAVEHAEKTQDLTSQLRESAGSAAEPTEEDVQNRAELAKQFERELAAIDTEIAEQEARVDRARAARDAAEAAQDI